MGLDIRIPIGLLFSIYGVLLTGSGLLHGPRRHPGDLNINFIWGLVMFVVGAVMLLVPWLRSREKQQKRGAGKTASA